MIKLNNIFKEDFISFMQKMAEENVFADVIVTYPPNDFRGRAKDRRRNDSGYGLGENLD